MLGPFSPLARLATCAVVALTALGGTAIVAAAGEPCPLLASETRLRPRTAGSGGVLTYAIKVTNTNHTAAEHVHVVATIPSLGVVFPAVDKRGAVVPSKLRPRKLPLGARTVVGNAVQLEDFRLGPRKSIVWKVKVGVVDGCVPTDALTFQAKAFLLDPTVAVPTCFAEALPSTIVVEPTDVCGAGAGVAAGAAPVAGQATEGPVLLAGQLTDLASTPEAPDSPAFTPAQAEYRAMLRNAKNEWLASIRVGDGGSDPVVQDTGAGGFGTTGANATAQAQAAISVELQQDGIGGGQYTPPDSSAAVGPDHVIQVTNVRFAIYHKGNGTLAMPGPSNINTIFSSLASTAACRVRNDGDPVVSWDRWNGRFVVAQFTSTNPYCICVAVSKEADPTKGWNAYQQRLSNNELWDYPKLGVFRDGYVFTFNRFGGTYRGGGIVLFQSPPMAVGQTPTVKIWIVDSTWAVGQDRSTMLPGGSDDVVRVPPSGSAMPILSLASTSIKMMKLTWDWGTTAPSITGATSPTIYSVASFKQLCPSTRNCIPQRGTTQTLDGLGDRLMNRVAYNYFDTYDSMIVCHQVQEGTTGTRAGVRWYELRGVNVGQPAIYQQSTFTPDATNRWIGTMAMEKNGNIALGYALSSTTIYPSVGITGRSAADPLGNMTVPEVIVGTGPAPLTGANRFGDYASMAVDPTDSCTFWLSQEYSRASTGSGWNWVTRLVKFNLGC